jgi:hypothetical protein
VDAGLIKGLLAVTVFCGLPAAAFGYWFFTGLQRGVVQGRGGPIWRSVQPVGYWIQTALYGLFFAVFGAVFVYVLWGSLTGR